LLLVQPVARFPDLLLDAGGPAPVEFPEGDERVEGDLRVDQIGEQLGVHRIQMLAVRSAARTRRSTNGVVNDPLADRVFRPRQHVPTRIDGDILAAAVARVIETVELSAGWVRSQRRS